MKLAEVMEITERHGSPTAVALGGAPLPPVRRSTALQEKVDAEMQGSTLALHDVQQELRHSSLPASKAGLASCLYDLARCEEMMDLMARDSLIRLAAWAIKAAASIDQRRHR